jgi:hypothetical protein
MNAQAATGDGARTEFEAVHDRLRDNLAPLREKLVATKDGPDGLTLEIPGLEGNPWGYVAGTRVGKRYVSYYLMSVYAFEDLRATLSPELQKRMQGKSCFNFSKVDEGLFDELERVTSAGFDRYLALARDVAKEKAGTRS